MDILIHVTTWVNLKNIMLSGQEPDVKDPTFYDSIYMKLLEKANCGYKADQRLLGAGGWEIGCRSDEGISQGDRILKPDCGEGCTNA